MKPSKQKQSRAKDEDPARISQTSDRSGGSSYKASQPTQAHQPVGGEFGEFNVSRTNKSTQHRFARDKSPQGKGNLSQDTGREVNGRGFSEQLDAADEHLARGSVELAFLGYSRGKFLTSPSF